MIKKRRVEKCAMLEEMNEAGVKERCRNAFYW